MSKGPSRKDGGVEPPRRPVLSVTDFVALTLPRGECSVRDFQYHQTATTADLAAFVREAERKLGRDVLVNINSSGLSASKTTDIQEG